MKTLQLYSQNKTLISAGSLRRNNCQGFCVLIFTRRGQNSILRPMESRYGNQACRGMQTMAQLSGFPGVSQVDHEIERFFISTLLPQFFKIYPPSSYLTHPFLSNSLSFNKTPMALEVAMGAVLLSLMKKCFASSTVKVISFI